MTDPDLDITCAPEDFEEVLMKGFSAKHEFIGNNDDIIKVGLNLKIDDLPEKSEDLIFDPDNVIAKKVMEEEKQKGLYATAQLERHLLYTKTTDRIWPTKRIQLMAFD